jgi:hypothetical protein
MAGPVEVRDATRTAGTGFDGVPADTADRTTPPARMAPTRNATTAVSASVTTVKRRDISL